MKPGLHIFSAGNFAAYEQAVEFLQKGEGTLLLGPRIGSGGQEWIRQEFLKSAPIQFGAKMQEWSEWVKATARSQTLAQGLSFRVFNAATKREYFRFILNRLTEAEAFEHLQELWQDEAFFQALLDCVEEARMAGLHQPAQLERAKELLGEEEAIHQDFWSLLLAYESGLATKKYEDMHDLPLLLRKAVEAEFSEPLFLLGFDHLALLELELVQKVAKQLPVILPVNLGKREIEQISRGKELAQEQKSAAMLRALLTGFSGEVSVAAQEPEAALSPAKLLDAHVPEEEFRVLGACGAAELQKGKFVRYIFPAHAESVAFFEELGLRFSSPSVLSHPVALLFFHALEMKAKNFPLPLGAELASLLAFTREEFSRVPEKALRAGIREGLKEWKEKSSDPELQKFANFLQELGNTLPDRATGAVYVESFEALAKLLGIGELARRAPDAYLEKQAHEALGALLKNSQMLAACVTEPMDFSLWLREWKALLAGKRLGELPSYFPQLQFFRYGEWLPPACENTVTFAGRWDSQILPRLKFHFYLNDRARMRLAEFLLPTSLQEEMEFLEHTKHLLELQAIVFSWSSHNADGKELEPLWLSSALPLVQGEWPALAPLASPAFSEKNESVQVPAAELSLSPSFLEAYKTCPFKAFALKILKANDKMRASALDLRSMEEGSIFHRALELFYGVYKGRTSGDPKSILEKSLQEAFQERKIEYYSGSDWLLEKQLERVGRVLWDFVQQDLEHYQKFPLFGDPLVEVPVQGTLGKISWSGKVDRVDLDPQNKKFLVVDYKSGATLPSSSEIEKLRQFQLPLYLDAMEAQLKDHDPLGGIYVSLKTGERKQGLVRKQFNLKKGENPEEKYFNYHSSSGLLKEEEEFSELRSQVRNEAIRLAGEAVAGDFSVKPLEESECARCEARPACRIHEIKAPQPKIWRREFPDFSATFRRPKASELLAKKESRFNEQQEDALQRRGNLVFIEASAGTGKTTVIVERVRRFFSEELAKGEPTHRVVEKFAAISFTDKSAKELSSRLSRVLVQEEGMGAKVAAQAIRQISTIHGFCRKIISDFPVEAGVNPLARLLDQKETDLVKDLSFQEFFLHPPEPAKALLEELFLLFTRPKVETILRRLLEKQALTRRERKKYAERDYSDLVAPGPEEDALLKFLDLGDLFADFYASRKKASEFLDFNDLEEKALQVLRDEKCRNFYRKKFSLLLVDEFQDTNSVQREILECLAQEGWKNLFVVGDAKQSIYRFRAADVSVFQGLRQEAEMKGNLVTLSINYRSRKELVEGANRISEKIFPNQGENAESYEATFAPVAAFQAEGGYFSVMEYDLPEEAKAEDIRLHEAKLVVDLVQAQLKKGRAPGEIAILMRKLASNDAYLDALTESGIPFQVGSSRGFYSQMPILDGISLLRTFYGPRNEMALLAFLRSPWMKLGEKEILYSWKSLSESPLLIPWKKRALFLSLSDFLQEAYAKYPLDRRGHLQVAKFIEMLKSLEAESLSRWEILDRISAWAGWEKEEDGSEDSTVPEPSTGGALQLMTVHSAKGLEFPVTILPDLGSSLQVDKSPIRIVPGVGLALKLEDDKEALAYKEVGEKNSLRDVAETKRLFYVALTRAQEECLILLPKGKEKKKKSSSWADLVRAAEIRTLGQPPQIHSQKSAGQKSEKGDFVRTPSIPFQFTTSITEIAAYQFCGEFHRLKYVQAWEDRVVALWPKPKFSQKKSWSKEKEEADLLLKKMGLEKKERGIALHRVLERTLEPSLPQGKLWLTEAYTSQGVDPDHKDLARLIELDLLLLERFLLSPLGKELFSPENQSFPEITFQWKMPEATLMGAMDRLVKRADGSWVVVDYKSSVHEENWERYRFQVASYMAAVSAKEKSEGREGSKVVGYLVNLYSAEFHEVPENFEQTRNQLSREIEKVRANYLLQDGELDFSTRNVVGGEHCLTCPYSLHCELGKKIVLA